MEFPEARIYEEMLNILLYENKVNSDTEVTNVANSKGPNTSGTSVKEEES